MATWTTVPDSSLEPGKPIRSIDALALRDNPVAIAEGQSGAPRIVDAALSTTVTSDGKSWVLNRNANASANEVGTYTVAWNSTTSAVAIGGTIAGSSLRVINAAGAATNNQFASIADTGSGFPSTSTTTLSGTWRNVGGHCFGRTGSGPYNWHPSLWLRIA